MAKLKNRERRLIEDVFGMNGGYVLDFTNTTFAEFFEDEFSINIYGDAYALDSGSKANRLRAFIARHDGQTIAKLLSLLLSIRIEQNSDSGQFQRLSDDKIDEVVFVIQRLNESNTNHVAKGLQDVSELIDFDTVQLDLDRALRSAESDPEDAVTAACSIIESVCRSILVELDEPFPAKRDIKGLFNAVKRPLGLSGGRTDLADEIANDVRQILSGLVTVVSGIGALRTHGGDAHGRERGYQRIDSRIAHLAIHGASTISIFLIDTWQRKFPDRVIHRK